jgi:hypothetical protein
MPENNNIGHAPMMTKPRASKKVTRVIMQKTIRVCLGDKEQFGLAVMEQCTDDTAPLMSSIHASLPLNALHYLFHQELTRAVGVLVLIASN